MNVSFFFLFVIFSLSVTCQAQNSEHHLLARLWQTYSPKEQEPHLRLPLLRQNDLRALVSCGAIAYLLMRSDQELDEEYALEIDDNMFRMLSGFGKIGELYDRAYSNYVIGGLALTAIGYSWISADPRPGTIVKQMAEALAVSTITTSVLKVSIGRRRPYTDDGAYAFQPFRFKLSSDRMSFPSGHTASMFAMMTVLAKNVRSPLVKVAAYTFASSVGLERMRRRKHWASDVIAGGFIGHLVGKLVVRHKRDKDGLLITLIPSLTDKMFGIGIWF